MAGHIAIAFPTRVWNGTVSAAERYAKEHGPTAVPLDEAVSADIVISCEPTIADVDDLVTRA